MTDFSVKIAANADDGYSQGSSFFTGGSQAYVGNISGTIYDAFFRFANVTIPNGVVVESAVVRFQHFGSGSAGFKSNLYIEDADDPSAPTSEGDFNGRSLSSAVAWDSDDTPAHDEYITTADFSSILTTHLSRVGWSSGQAVQIIIKDDGSDADARRAVDQRDTSATTCAELQVTYSIPIEPSVNETVNLTESVTVALETLPGQVSTFENLAVTESVEASIGIEPDVSETVNITESVAVFIAGDIKPDEFESVTVEESVTVALDILIDSVWLSPIKENAKERYYFTLTGAPDATTDIEIPISSFQARKRAGESTYLSVVVPDYTGQAAAIAARPNGEMVIELALILNGVETVREEILRVDLEDIQPAAGGRNRSITLTGHATQTFNKSIMTLEDSIYRTVSGGLITHRFAKCDPYLNPGDVVYVGDDTIVVDYVIYNVSARFKSMEIREA